MSWAAVTSFAFWTPAGVFLNAIPSVGEAARPLAPWPGAPSLGDIHPRARRPHAQAIELVRLAHALVTERQRSAPPEAPPLSLAELGMLLGTASGSARADQEFEEGLASRGAGFGSPSAFVYTLSTSAPAEVTLALGLHGPLATLSMGALSGVAAVARATGHVRSGRLSACICGGGELPGQPAQGARTGLGLFLLERVEGASPWPALEVAGLSSGVPGQRLAHPAVDPLEPLAELAAATVATSAPVTSLSWGSPTGASVRLNVRRPPEDSL